jgi:hypothetical protein
LLELLKEPENQVREWAKLELERHDSMAVTAALERWVEGLDRNDPAHEHHLMEALWVHQWHNVIDPRTASADAAFTRTSGSGRRRTRPLLLARSDTRGADLVPGAGQR